MVSCVLSVYMGFGEELVQVSCFVCFGGAWPQPKFGGVSYLINYGHQEVGGASYCQLIFGADLVN